MTPPNATSVFDGGESRTMNPDIFVARPRWTIVARIVSERLDKTYAGNYVLQIASGTRTNSQVAEILKELGVMRSQTEDLTHTSDPKSAKPFSSVRTDWLEVSREVSAKLGGKYAANYCAEVARGRRNSVKVEGLLQEMGVMPKAPLTECGTQEQRQATSKRFANVKAACASERFGIPIEDIKGSSPSGSVFKRDVLASAASIPRYLSQRRTLARHLHDLLIANRSLCAILAATQDRLAATSSKLGEALNDKLTLELKLQSERETSARLDGVVRRLTTRPHIKRTTTHVNIAGLLFRNRTGAIA